MKKTKNMKITNKDYQKIIKKRMAKCKIEE